ncbi:MAG: SPFH domain-containing protein [Anaerolineae bacterium]
MSRQSQQARDRAAERVAKGLPAMIDEASATLEMLRTEADRVRGLLAMFGLGRRILVPPDEIHVVVGDGRHIFVLSRKSRVFGQTADRSSTYWLNRLSQVIKLKTISFTVPIRGDNDEGVPALDSSKVSFNLWAHAVAKLNPDKAEVAAQRVGLDATSLINTITEVGTAELVAAAATMTLEEIIAQRQKLAEIAFPQVNQILSELGYDLALLTITNLDGIAYNKLINQAEARISKETSISTNREQVAELQDDEARQRQESEIKATTEKKLAAERLDAEREVETATLNQQETLAIQRHEVQLKQVDRDKDAARATHEVELEKVQLGQKLSEAEVEKQAQLARVTAERDAELRAMQQERNAKIRLAETEAEAERMAAEQVRKIERDAERTQAEAKRLEQEELAKAERAKQVALVEAAQLGESLKVEAESESRALQIKAEAETKAELVRADAETRAELIRAEAEATATEKRAQAAKVRAEATRAEAAAPGLAEAEVDAARVEVSEKQVSVTRAEGLARAEVAQAQATAEAERTERLKEIEINAQRELVKLYDQAPVLVDLEKLRLQFAHEERIATLQMEAYLKAFEALAPSLQVRIYGSGGQTTQIITDLMSMAQGVKALGEEVPVVGRLVGSGAGTEALSWLPKLADFVPFIRQVMADTNPRMFTSLKVTDLLDRLVPVLAGREDLLTALNALRDDAGFRVVGDVPVVPLLRLLGIKVPETTAESTAKPVDVGIVVESDEQPDEDQKSVAAAIA